MSGKLRQAEAKEAKETKEGKEGKEDAKEGKAKVKEWELRKMSSTKCGIWRRFQ